MVYFDVRPSAHVPTVELRVPDACPNVDDVLLLAGIFRALVARESEAVAAGRPRVAVRPPLARAAMWRAARSGLEGDLLLLSSGPAPMPAADAVDRLIAELRPYLEAAGDFGQVRELADQALGRGSAAARQRRALARRGRLFDVVDILLEETQGAAGGPPGIGTHGAGALPAYVHTADEVFGDGEPDGVYRAVIGVLHRLGPTGLRQREDARDEEQRSRGVTFGVTGEATTRLFPFDLVPRVVTADDWAMLRSGLIQRARALDAFLHDVYTKRAAIHDGIIPAWVVDGSPGLRPTGALMGRQPVRAQVVGTDLVRNANGDWFALEDNLRVPSGLGYAMQNRRLTRAILPELEAPPELLPSEETPVLLRRVLADANPSIGREPVIVVLSGGPTDSAWFEHQLLAGEMGVPLVATTDLIVGDGAVHLQREGRRQRVDVIYLRIDEDALLHAPAADGRPIGPPLLAAVHAGRVALANALGNGVGDDKAVYAYVPRFVEYYLGEKPLLGDVPTYLCGVDEQRVEVVRRLDQLVVKPVDGYGGDRVLIGHLASGEEIEAARRQIATAPHRWIAQETVPLSTHPVFDGDALSPRHVDLRAFVFLGEQVEVAPVALTRVAPAGSMVVNSSRGGGSKDTWLLGKPVPGPTEPGGRGSSIAAGGR
jgi:carboxylate-amine ligase